MQEIDFNIHTEAICFIIPIFFRVEDFVNDSPTICSHVLLSCIDVFLLPPCNIQKTESEVTICQSNLLKPLVNIMLSPENSSVAGTEQKADNSSIFAKLKSCVRNTPMNY